MVYSFLKIQTGLGFTFRSSVLYRLAIYHLMCKQIAILQCVDLVIVVVDVKLLVWDSERVLALKQRWYKCVLGHMFQLRCFFFFIYFFTFNKPIGSWNRTQFASFMYVCRAKQTQFSRVNDQQQHEFNFAAYFSPDDRKTKLPHSRATFTLQPSGLLLRYLWSNAN